MSAAFAAFVSAAWAYLPPVDEKGGVRVEVGSFPQRRLNPHGGPYRDKKLGVTHVAAAANGVTSRTFPVVLSNLTAKAVSGRLEVWLTDDWEVSGPAGALTLAPGEGKSLSFSAAAKPCALDVLYPVHARFTPDGAAADAAAHPVAVFKFDNPKAPRNVPKSVCLDARTDFSAASRAACAARATAAAHAALTNGTDAAAGRWRLEADGVAYGAGVAYGRNGLLDGSLVFTDGTRDVVYDGFTAKVVVAPGAKAIVPRAEVREEKGTLRISWTLGVKPDEGGVPRIADLAPGCTFVRPKRLYMGFGCVYQDPGKFTVRAAGHALSTRHVGVDYANGLSVVQAVDVVPDSLVCDGKRNYCSLHAHHDVTFTFVPSAKGSFEAARRFRAVAGYRKSPGHETLGSRMCIDRWEGDFRALAADLAKAAKYGLGDSIFIKHMWQRWGYDFRLPEVYPPANDPEGYGIMREACRAAGMLFCPHDNYTDIYPDADAYSLDRVTFNLDGTPQIAWLNVWFDAQSYRWAPHAIHPWVERNARLLKNGYDPDAIFIDVLTAVCPWDSLDRAGRFRTKNETSACWAKAFGIYREAYGKPNAVCVSEAGMDHLVGVVDAGECDHNAPAWYVRPKQYGDAERVPWHDIVTHGYFVMLAGGVGGRSQATGSWDGGGDPAVHGYASDGYFCTCIMGGRNPMSDGPFTRNAVKTFYQQHDACAELGRAEFLDCTFEGGDIHRQHMTFSDSGEVWVNRGRTSWRVPEAGVTLPTDGYYAKTRTTTSGVVEKDGVRCAFAKSPAAFFVDARTPAVAAPPVPRPRTPYERDYAEEVALLQGRDVPGREPQAERDRRFGVNRAHVPVDFGGIVTDGSFRFTGGDTLVPLPRSAPFKAKIDLAAFGAKGRRIDRVEALEPAADAREPKWTQAGDALALDVDARAFGYRLVFR